jgi:amidase
MQSSKLSGANLPKNALIENFLIQPKNSGALDYLTFAVKDVIDVVDYKTGCGNPTWLSQQKKCKVNAACVEQLLTAGATCVGKTILGEFCSGTLGLNHFYGMPLNPLAPDRVPGGSSSGSASIVASGEVDFSLGTDVAGSMRVPASFCGIYGLRPSFGTISMSGVKSFASTFDTVGIFSNKLNILAVVYEVLSGKKSEQDAWQVNKFFVIEDFLRIVSPEQSEKFQRFIAESCQALKLEPTYIQLKEIHNEIMDPIVGLSPIFRNIFCVEIWETLKDWIKEVNLEFSKNTFVNFSQIAKADKKILSESFNRMEVYSVAINKLLSTNSLLCIPTTPDVAPFRNREFKQVNEFDYDKLTPLVSISSLAKLPQINIPIQVMGSPPLGISLLSGNGKDLFLIDVVKKIMS